MIPEQISKRINFNFQGQKLIFDTSLSLFSHASIDFGTKELINSLRKNIDLRFEKVLDLGCGYGPISIFVKKQYPGSKVYFSDKDSLAIDFTKNNFEINNIKFEKSFISPDFESIDERDFSLILTNFPAKLEKGGLKKFLFSSSNFLNKKGILGIVVVKELVEDFETILKEVNLEKEIVAVSFKEISKHYGVFHINFSEKLNPEQNLPLNKVNFSIGKKYFSLETHSALDEFSFPHFTTDLLEPVFIDIRKQKFEKICLLNCGQSFRPLFVLHYLVAKEFSFISRDILELDLLKSNLIINKLDSEKMKYSCTDLFEGQGDLLIWSTKEENIEELIKKFSFYKKNFKKIIFSGRKTILNRFILKLKLKPTNEYSLEKYCTFLISN